jgi:hypothetical protein
MPVHAVVPGGEAGEAAEDPISRPCMWFRSGAGPLRSGSLGVHFRDAERRSPCRSGGGLSKMRPSSRSRAGVGLVGAHSTPPESWQSIAAFVVSSATEAALPSSG